MDHLQVLNRVINTYDRSYDQQRLTLEIDHHNVLAMISNEDDAGQSSMYTASDCKRLAAAYHRDAEDVVLFGRGGNGDIFLIEGIHSHADDQIRVRKLNVGELQSFEGHISSVDAVTFSPDGQYILTGSPDKTAKLWDLNGNLIQTFEGHTNHIKEVASSRDGQYLLTASRDTTVKLWHRNGNLIRTFSGNNQYHNPVAISPDGQYILISRDKSTQLWGHEGDLIRTFEGHMNTINVLAFSPDGQRFLSGGGDNTAKLWDLSGNLIQNFVIPSNTIMTLAFSSNGQLIMAGSRSIKLWDLNNNLIQDFRGHSYITSAAAYYPDKQLILAGLQNIQDHTATLWTRNNNLVRTFYGHKGTVHALAFSPNGEKVLTGASDRTAKLWDLDNFAGAITAASCQADHFALFGLSKQGAILHLSIENLSLQEEDVVACNYQKIDPEGKTFTSIAATSLVNGEYHLFGLTRNYKLWLYTTRNKNWYQIGADLYWKDIIAASGHENGASVFGLNRENKVIHLSSSFDPDFPGATNWGKHVIKDTDQQDFDASIFSGAITTTLEAPDASANGTPSIISFCKDENVKRLRRQRNDQWQPSDIDAFKNRFAESPFSNLVAYPANDRSQLGLIALHRKTDQYTGKTSWPILHWVEGRNTDQGFIGCTRLNYFISQNGGFQAPTTSMRLTNGPNKLIVALRPEVHTNPPFDRNGTYLYFGRGAGERGHHPDNIDPKEASCVRITFPSYENIVIPQFPANDKEIIRVDFDNPKLKSYIHQIPPVTSSQLVKFRVNKNRPEERADRQREYLLQDKVIIHIWDDAWNLKCTMDCVHQYNENGVLTGQEMITLPANIPSIDDDDGYEISIPLSQGQGLKVMAFISPTPLEGGGCAYEIGDPERDAKVYTSDMD